MELNECNFIPRIDLSSIDSPSIDGYHNKTSQLLCNITLDHDMLSCNEISCNNSDHELSIANTYLCIIKALSDSSHNLIPAVGTKGHFQPITGWSDYVKTVHSYSREDFWLWQSNSKPRFGHLYDIMNSSRARFKQCLRFCESNEDRARIDAVATNLLLIDNVSFWKEVNKMNRTGNNVLASTINGVTGENNITKVWYDLINSMLNLS